MHVLHSFYPISETQRGKGKRRRATSAGGEGVVSSDSGIGAATHMARGAGLIGVGVGNNLWRFFGDKMSKRRVNGAGLVGSPLWRFRPDLAPTKGRRSTGSGRGAWAGQRQLFSVSSRQFS
ncbi:hypothetical protein FXO38_09838 [Capsicum annuum]|nr:hypothetical protein FXO37_28757 [Capsicum annuum]KAF3665008.1 hypothetical protein FXO38_09838 [Capsicum annuum]